MGSNRVVESRLPISDVCLINPKTGDHFESADLVAFVAMADLDAEAAVAADSGQRRFAEVQKGYTPFRNGDVLVAKITPCFENRKIGEAVTSTSAAFGSTEFHVLRPISERLDRRYLLHFLRQDAFLELGKTRMTGAGGQRRVPERLFHELEIPLPPIEEQRRIAAVLDAADAFRTKRRQVLAKLDTLTQAIFIDMFGDPVSNPRGWPTAALSDHYEFKNGLNFSGTDRTDGPHGLLTLDVSNMYSNDIVPDFSGCYRVDLSVSAHKLLEVGDLVFVRSSVKREGVAWPAYFAGHSEPVAFCGFLIRARLIDESTFSAMPEFLVHYLRQAPVRMQLIASSNQVAITNINQQRLGEIQIPLPPESAQLEFAACLKDIGKVRRVSEQSLAQLDTLFASLQQRAFRGEL